MELCIQNGGEQTCHHEHSSRLRGQKRVKITLGYTRERWGLAGEIEEMVEVEFRGRKKRGEEADDRREQREKEGKGKKGRRREEWR